MSTKALEKEISSKLKSSVTKDSEGFLSKFSILPLAIGVIIGQATKDLVNKLVEDILSPIFKIILSIVTPQTDLKKIVITIRGIDILIGDFLDKLLEVVLLVLIIYLTLRVLNNSEKILNPIRDTLQKADGKKRNRKKKDEKREKE